MPKKKSHIDSVHQLPHFCQAETLYLTIIASVLLAFLLSFVTPNWHIGFWQHLSFYSLFILWTALTSLAILCLVRQYWRELSLTIFSLIAIATILSVTLAYSLLISFYLSEQISFWFLLRNLMIALLVSGVFFRFYILRQESLKRIQSEAEARVQALQSRIRPHFLFNSLNMLANLAVTQPEKTENLILDMADIFRASMQRSDILIPFSDEKLLCNQYLGLEKQRLGDKLLYQWHTDTIADNLLVPPLLLQPLIENAVYHGVQARSEGGTIIVKGISYKDYIQLEITNPLSDQGANLHKGNSLALSNIRQRLEVIYGSKAHLLCHQANGHFICTLKIPKQL